MISKLIYVLKRTFETLREKATLIVFHQVTVEIKILNDD